MARALIVGCGCRGRALGASLLGSGWAVRGTARDGNALDAIERAGIEPAFADPDRPGTVLDLVGDAAVVYWLLGSAQGPPGLVAALHGPRLQRLLERLVDTPVRGFAYEGGGTVDEDLLREGGRLVRAAAERWRIPVEVVAAEPRRHEQWLTAMLAAAGRLVG